MKQTIDRITVAFGPSAEELSVSDWLRHTAGDRGLNRIIKQAIREYQDKHTKKS